MQVQSLDFWKKHFFRKFVIPGYKLCTIVRIVRHKTCGKISLAAQFFYRFLPPGVHKIVGIKLELLGMVDIYKVQHKFENLNHCSKFSNLANIKNKNFWWRFWKKVNFQSKFTSWKYLTASFSDNVNSRFWISKQFFKINLGRIKTRHHFTGC